MCVCVCIFFSNTYIYTFFSCRLELLWFGWLVFFFQLFHYVIHLTISGIYIPVLQNPLTLESVKQLIAAGNTEELKNCFSARMEFGTAGLRAAMGAGISHMNDLTIIQTTQVPHFYTS